MFLRFAGSLAIFVLKLPSGETHKPAGIFEFTSKQLLLDLGES
jgi:hypothetical protein